MLWEGACQECGAEGVEFFSSKDARDEPRKHCEVDSSTDCEGTVKRYPYPGGFAVKWKYGKNDKVGTFMGPSDNVYRTDTTERARIAKTRTVHGPAYRGAKTKDG
jgi:hypothetical protein